MGIRYAIEDAQKLLASMVEQGVVLPEPDAVARQELIPPARQHVSDAAWEALRDACVAPRVTHEYVHRRHGTVVVTVAEWDARGQAADSEGPIIARLRAQLEGWRQAQHSRVKGAQVLRKKIDEAEAENDDLRRQLAERDAKDRRLFGPFPTDRQRQESAVQRLMKP